MRRGVPQLPREDSRTDLRDGASFDQSSNGDRPTSPGLAAGYGPAIPPAGVTAAQFFESGGATGGHPALKDRWTSSGSIPLPGGSVAGGPALSPDDPATLIEFFAAQNRILARAMDVARHHKRTLLALLATAASFSLAMPGRVEPEPAELSTSEMGLFP